MVGRVLARDAQISDLADVLALFDETLGCGQVSAGCLQDLQADDRGGCLVACDEHGAVAGAGTVQVCDPVTLACRLPSGQEDLLPVLLDGAVLVGLLGHVAVSPAHRGEGLGAALTAGLISWARRRGATRALAFAWDHDVASHRAGMLRRARLEAGPELDGFWSADSRRVKYACPACRHDCACTTVIYTADLTAPSGRFDRTSRSGTTTR